MPTRLRTVTSIGGQCFTVGELPYTLHSDDMLSAILLYFKHHWFLFQRTNKLAKELKKIIPNSGIFYLRGLDLKKVIPQALSRDYTDIIVINENMKIPSILYNHSEFLLTVCRCNDLDQVWVPCNHCVGALVSGNELTCNWSWKHSATVVSACWATVDGSWPKEWN